MGHGERAVEFVKIKLGQVEKLDEQLREVVRAIFFHFEADGTPVGGFDRDGTIRVVAGTPQQFLSYGPDGGPATKALFGLPTSVAIDVLLDSVRACEVRPAEPAKT